MKINRRGFLCLTGGLIAAPMLVKAESLMPVVVMEPIPTIIPPSQNCLLQFGLGPGANLWWKSIPDGDLIEMSTKSRMISLSIQNMSAYDKTYSIVRNHRGDIVIPEDVHAIFYNEKGKGFLRTHDSNLPLDADT